MPGFDGTGPLGEGQMTGRGLGPCGRGSGFRRVFGRGFGRRAGTGFRQVVTEKQEKELLKDELKAVEQEKQEIEKRLKELK